jgi:hypothetical protein
MLIQGVASIMGGIFAAICTQNGNPFICFKIISCMGLACSASGFLINKRLETAGDLIAEDDKEGIRQQSLG